MEGSHFTGLHPRSLVISSSLRKPPSYRDSLLHSQRGHSSSRGQQCFTGKPQRSAAEGLGCWREMQIPKAPSGLPTKAESPGEEPQNLHSNRKEEESFPHKTWELQFSGRYLPLKDRNKKSLISMLPLGQYIQESCVNSIKSGSLLRPEGVPYRAEWKDTAICQLPVFLWQTKEKTKAASKEKPSEKGCTRPQSLPGKHHWCLLSSQPPLEVYKLCC